MESFIDLKIIVTKCKKILALLLSMWNIGTRLFYFLADDPAGEYYLYVKFKQDLMRIKCVNSIPVNIKYLSFSSHNLITIINT